MIKNQKLIIKKSIKNSKIKLIIVNKKNKNLFEEKNILLDKFMNNQLEYSDSSISLTKKINKTEKKSGGIFFTPPKTVYENIKFLTPYFGKIKTVLEPSCGSCEFILMLKSFYPNLNITGVEFNKTIFEYIKELHDDKFKLINEDFLISTFDHKYDLIIGNPPYFVMKKKDVEEIYYDFFEGRPNIFILFILKSLKLLNENGIVSFVLPKNFLSCLYYNKTRKHIFDNYTILNITDVSEHKYIETQQDTITLVVQNTKPISNKVFTLNIYDYTIFSTKENVKNLIKLYDNSKTLKELGFTVSVGNVVWNQCKDQLTNDSNKTLLIYSSDISNNKLSIKKYSNKEKKNYINKDGNRDPLLVINRGYGVGSYNFNYCIINEKENIEYLIENHLICIKYTQPIKKQDLINKYKQIIKSFTQEKTQKFINLYFANNAMNTTELSEIIPIYNFV